MKIRELRLKNLNSLYGEWEIDFTSDLYQDSGIFLISGPTGAGKTTVLDAICLALYGKTPRLQTINSSTNEIMSRHTGDCYSEVVFETGEGLYQSRWSQRRARSSEDGNLQSQKREISTWNPETNQFDLLETYTSRVDDVVREKTGMTFGRFTRSIMLAQGQFAAFLQAKDDERSETLEQITGTEIYSRISKAVFERHKLEKEKLEALEKTVDDISQMTETEFFELEIEKSEKDRIIKAQQKEIETIRQQEEWLRTIKTLQQNLDENASEIKHHGKEVGDFAPNLKILAAAEKTVSVAAPFEKMRSLRDQVQKDGDNLTRVNVDLETSTTERDKRKVSRAEISKQRKEHGESSAKELKTIKEVRKLDTRIKSLEQSLLDLNKKSGLGEQEIGKVEAELSEALKQREKSEADLKIHLNYLSENESDQRLDGALPRLSEQIGQWRKTIATTEKLKARLPGLKEKQAEIEGNADQKAKQLKQGESQLKNLEKQISNQDNNRNNLLGEQLAREIKKEAETLEEKLRLEEKIVSLEGERKKLIADAPCPLCGSTEHPYSDGHLPETSSTRKALKAIKAKLQELDENSDAIQKLENEKAKHAVSLEKLKGQSILCQQEVKAAIKEIASLESDIEKTDNEVTECLSAIQQSLAPFGVDSTDNLESIFQTLNQRDVVWKHHEKEVKRLNEFTGETGEQIAGLTARLKALRETRDATNLEAQTLNETLVSLRSDRARSFGDKDPDHEEERLNNETKEFENAETQATEALSLADQKVAEYKKIISDLSNRLKENEPKLKQSRESFEASLAKYGFKDEATFLSKMLPADEFNDLKDTSSTLEKRSAELKALGKDLKSRLDEEQKKKLTKKNSKQLEELRIPLIESNHTLSEIIGQLTAQLKREEENREKKRSRLQEFAGQRAKYEPWKQLNQLIGSADGKRYRNFAQGLTFEEMVGHANHQLAKMTDRYLLQRDSDPAKALTLNVIDHYQGGEIRPTTNLSGGETFLVSLALALGLSQMASDQVRVDSLFLDEGFGTLDEETLEEALDALANLKKEEKLIGVISHVPSLKERLSVQLKVERKSGGQSVLSGPGVSILQGES